MVMMDVVLRRMLLWPVSIQDNFSDNAQSNSHAMVIT